MNLSNLVTFNIGGQLFTTERKILTNNSTYFKTLFGGSFSTDKYKGEIFIDRSRYLFDQILQKLRSGKKLIFDITDKQLIEEAIFYGMDYELDELSEPNIIKIIITQKAYYYSNYYKYNEPQIESVSCNIKNIKEINNFIKLDKIRYTKYDSVKDHIKRYNFNIYKLHKYFVVNDIDSLNHTSTRFTVILRHNSYKGFNELTDYNK